LFNYGSVRAIPTYRIDRLNDTEPIYFIFVTFIDQRRAPPDVHLPSATPTDLTFSSSMSIEDFFKWLRVKGVNDEDCKTLTGKCKHGAS
jgi:hypothetical protein